MTAKRCVVIIRPDYNYVRMYETYHYNVLDRSHIERADLVQFTGEKT